MIKRLLFLFTLMIFVQAANSQTIAKWKVEDVVKAFSVKNDTVYVVNFWATFCKPCIAEIPDFIRLVDKYKTQKVKLLLVSLDLPTYYPAKIADFAKKNHYKTNIVWLNETDADHFCPMIDEKWSGAIPSTIIVNNSIGYRKFVEDQMSPEEFENAIKAAIGGSAFYKFTEPMNDAEINDHKEQVADGNVYDFITFKASDSSVFAVMGGKVSTVAKIDNMKVIIIEKDKIYCTYSNIGSTRLKPGDEVKPGQQIGYAAFDLDGYKPTIDLYIYGKDTTISLTKENFVVRKDKRLQDHSIDNNEPK